MTLTTGDLGGRAVRGASVTMIGQFARIFMMLVSTIILSRLFAPEDFGLLAIVMSVITLGELLRDFGLSTAAARSTTINQRQKTNLFWINTGLGGLCAGLAVVFSNSIGTLFGQPEIGPLLSILSVVFVLTGAAAQFRAELNRELRFAALTLCDTVPIFAGLIAAVLYATLIEADFWALAIQQIVVAASGLIMSAVASRWMPGVPNRESVREFTSFGAGLFGTQFIAYFTKNSDNLALGYFWGPAVTGLYGRAYQILMVPINQVLAPLTRVAVPILSRVANDSSKFVKYVTAAHVALSVILAVTFGMLIGLGEPAVALVFGAQWAAMVPIFQALAVGGIFRGMNQIAFWVFLAKDQTGKQFRFYLWSQPIIVVAMMAGLPWGALGVAIGHTVGYAINWVLSTIWCSKATSTRLYPLLRNGLIIIAVFMCPSILFGLISTHVMSSHILSVFGFLLCEFIYLAGIYVAFKRVRDFARMLLAPLTKWERRNAG